MIRKLRCKFVLINMLFVALILLAVFTILLFSQKQRLENESYDALVHAVDRTFSDAPNKFEIIGKPDMPRDKPPFASLPIFTVLLRADGTSALRAENVDVSTSLVDEAVLTAVQSGQQRGLLPGLGLRFLLRDTPDGIKIAFADLSSERSALTSQALSALLSGFGALLAFFLMSMFLANWVFRPAEQAWQRQQQFVADASHELKTPLTVILANTDILLSHPSDTVFTQKKWVEYTRDEARRMKTLVDDLLFLAKSDASPHNTSHLPFDLSDAVWSCLLPFEPVAFERGVSLSSDVAEDVSMRGDAGQIKQLVMILLDNACKYSAGQVSFMLVRELDRAVLRVSNNGEPIPPDALPHLFERFYRSDKSRTRGEGDLCSGHGLGLAIAERIVQAHHGRISTESNATSGTVFTISLPLK